MNICPNCNKKSKHSFCPECGTETAPVLQKDRSITLSGIICTLILAAFAVLLPLTIVEEFIRADGASFVRRLTCGIAGGACMLILGVWLWGLARWMVFAVPRTFRATKTFLSSIIPLTFLALIVELMLGIWLTLLPMAVYGMTASMVIGVVKTLREADFSLLVALSLLALSVMGFGFVAYREALPILNFFREKKTARAVQE
jgi:hypothetical protein